MAALNLNEYSIEEVARHSTAEDGWIIIDDLVYNISKFAILHPGGEKELLRYAGKDATAVFYGLHRSDVLQKYFSKLCVGKIRGKNPANLAVISSKVSPISSFPWAEASWMNGWESAYFTKKHFEFALRARETFDRILGVEGPELEESGELPSKQLMEKMGAAENGNILLGLIGVGKHLHGKTVLGVKGEEFDYFHESILQEQGSRLGIRGAGDGIFGGMCIGLPPLLNYGTPAMKPLIEEILAGRKRICLCISEPYVGSDVADLKCSAKKTADGKHFVVNGVKKWITGGMVADYFTVAVRTGGPGAAGISMLLVPRGEGVTTKPIKTSYSATAGTSLIIFEDVLVPVENLLGKENYGFQIIMSNFNHERWVMIVATQRYTRLAIEECIKWSNQREVFGKKLLDQPVIRYKLANMVARTESVQAWLEQITFQMCKNGYQNKKIGSAIALCKMETTRVSHYVADEAVQIFGGRGITKSGMGRIIENYFRTIKFSAILGGSEEILGDMAIRMETKNLPPSKL